MRGGGVVALSMVLGFSAEAGVAPRCSLATDEQFLCPVGETAADAYWHMKHLAAPTATPYEQRLWRHYVELFKFAGCKVMHGHVGWQVPIIRERTADIPEPDGNVAVLFIKIPANQLHGWIAAPFFSGQCPR